MNACRRLTQHSLEAIPKPLRMLDTDFDSRRKSLASRMSKGHQLNTRIKQAAVAAGISAIGLASFGSTAHAAAPTITVTPNTGISSTGSPNVTVAWSGLTGKTVVFIQECRVSDTDPLFDPINDCSTANEYNPASVNGAGSFSFPLFTGAEPINGAWGCGDPADSAAAGAPISATCFIRATPDTDTNVGNDTFQAITFAPTPPADVPEVPLNVLLPLGGAAILGGAYFVARKRQMANVI